MYREILIMFHLKAGDLKFSQIKREPLILTVMKTARHGNSPSQGFSPEPQVFGVGQLTLHCALPC